MGSWFSSPSSRLKLNVHDLRTGRAYSITVPDPKTYTVKELVTAIKSRITDISEDEMILKFSRNDLTKDMSVILFDIEGLKDKSKLFVEKVESKGTLARPWNLHIKTLTGIEHNVQVSSPQDVCVYGLKLLVEDVSGISPDQMRLVIEGDQMEDGPPHQPHSITSFPAICNDCTIHLVLKNPGR